MPNVVQNKPTQTLQHDSLKLGMLTSRSHAQDHKRNTFVRQSEPRPCSDCLLHFDPSPFDAKAPAAFYQRDWLYDGLSLTALITIKVCAVTVQGVKLQS